MSIRYLTSNYHHIISPASTASLFRHCQNHVSYMSNASSSPLQHDYDPETCKNLYNNIIPKIGLEVHAQLDLNSKLFSQGVNSSFATPNSQLDYFDISLPGTLPKVNKNSLRASILTGLGLNCTIQNMIHFDRKNYFYNDMPAGYQITQYNNPIAKNGFIDFIVTTYHKSVIGHSQQYDLVKYIYAESRRDLDEVVPYIKRSRIKQIQLEQDSAKTLHQTSADTGQELYTLVDYNRCGAGLIEIVFEPDLTNHHEASSLIKELIYTLKALGVCTCELQEGSLRVDANVSIHSISGQEINKSGRVELKNLNSLRSLNRGILFEIKRQANLLEAGGEVLQESRTYDTKTGQTVPLRLKEESVDYRYVPEPNIPPIMIEQDVIEEARAHLPSDLPGDVRQHLISEYNLELALVSEIMEEPGLSDYFTEIMSARANYDANVIADFLIYTISNLKRLESVVGHLSKKVDLSKGSEFRQRLSVDRIQTLFDMMLDEEISFMIAYEVIKLIFVNGDKSEPRKIVNDLGWYQINDHVKVDELCMECVQNMKNVSKQYAKKGEKRHLRIMLEKLCDSTNHKISVRRAIENLNARLKPPQTGK